MELNLTPNSNRIHISFFGKTNAGKSSLVNAFTNQEISIVSDINGTTTDPVSKQMELLPLGPVLITDTAGFDDFSPLGEKRLLQTKKVLRKTDVAVLVTDTPTGLSQKENAFVSHFKEMDIPYFIVRTKCDLYEKQTLRRENEIYVSSFTKENIDALKEKIAKEVSLSSISADITGAFMKEKGFALLVAPIDESAPKGRLILPQVQTIRDILDKNAFCMVAKPSELNCILYEKKIAPDIVITDSQVFKEVETIIPENIPLTSFSILMAKQKGFLECAVNGVKQIDFLKDGDKILISEGCTHHRQCKDIGTVKLPALLTKYTRKNLDISFSQGGDFPENLKDYKLIIHCGGCMLNQREMKYRMRQAQAENVAFTNYGTAIAFMNGILKRSVAVFEALKDII